MSAKVSSDEPGADLSPGTVAVRKADLEIEKLSLEILALKGSSGIQARKLAAELADLQRPLLFRNLGVAATTLTSIVALVSTALLGMCSTARLANERITTEIAEKFVIPLQSEDPAQRLAAARGIGQLETAAAYSTLNAALDGAIARGRKDCNSISAGDLSEHAWLRLGAMEAVALSDRDWPLPTLQRLTVAKKGLHDACPLVRYKAMLALSRHPSELGLLATEFEAAKKHAGAGVALDSSGHDMVQVPAGLAVFGSDVGSPNEAPAHQRRVEAFFIDRRLVTNSNWNAAMRASPALGEPAHELVWPHLRAYRLDKDRGQLPVVGASFAQAQAFCRASGGRRLPTELEWEVAARGHDGWPYPWGHHSMPADEVIQAQQKFVRETKDPETRKRGGVLLAVPRRDDESVLGVQQLVTAVFQWTNTEMAGRRAASEEPQACTSSCVLKGAPGFDPDSSSPSRMWASRRVQWGKDNADDHIGFRCAKDAEGSASMKRP